MIPPRLAALALLCVLLPGTSLADEEYGYDPALFQGMSWRLIGPFRGGRSAAVAGHPDQPRIYYAGATGGGVWKTEDAGSSWRNISDGYFGGSIGAVAVAESDPDVVYVGGGEVTVRGNVSSGSGLWKSMDAGKTWQHSGLGDSRHIPRIRVHPSNPDLVYAAVLGHLYGPSEMRGVYRSKDGGKSWERVLFANVDAGAVDLTLDPFQPRVLYASTWRVRRTPYSLESGGEGSGLWRSHDGGDTWAEITRNRGLPAGPIGIIGITASPARRDRLWAIVEAEEGGVFRSDNGGESWTRTSEDRNLRQRAWYYSRIHADPRNEDTVYVLNVRFHRSRDGGKTFETVSTPHSDNHDLWIDPGDPLRMVEANDGGANVSFDGGATWSAQDNQPTAQFYRVVTDNHFPYRIYGAQQDNSTVRIAHRSDSFGIGERHWEPTAGGESGHIAPHPEDPDIVYGGSYGGYLTRINHRTGEQTSVNVWPDDPMGWGCADLKYRFQWNFPIFFSPHDSGTLYTAANVLFRSRDEGHSWEAISPDLTRNDRSKMGPSGGPITKDNTSVEYYGTVFAALESPHEPGVLWTGSDDGRIHLSRDGGATWKDVTPSHMPEWMMINSLEAHPTEPGGLYVAGTRYKLDDFRPYLYKTADYGQTWVQITHGIADEHFTRVLRADPGRRGLLYAGTEEGVYASFDDGRHWMSLQLGLPIVPITDLAVKEGDLIAATQGRAFWVLDDLTLLHQLRHAVIREPLHLFQPRPTLQLRGGGGGRGNRGANPDGGVRFRFLLDGPLAEGEVQLEIRDARGELLRRFATEPGEDWDEMEKKDGKLSVKAGLNEFRWNMRLPGARSFEGLVLWGGGMGGPLVPPGEYQAVLCAGDRTAETTFQLAKDPRQSATREDYVARFEFLLAVRDKLSETHQAIRDIRDLRGQLEHLSGRIQGEAYAAEVRANVSEILIALVEIEEALYQTRNRSSQDPLNFPVRLNNKLSSLGGLVASSDSAPTVQAVAVQQELTAKIDEQLARWYHLLEADVPALNEFVEERKVPAVSPPRAEWQGEIGAEPEEE